MVLLKNDGLLPLTAGSKIAVVGPMGVNQDLMSDYAGGTGEAGCWPNSDSSCVPINSSNTHEEPVTDRAAVAVPH
jgi:hypothetical protein